MDRSRLVESLSLLRFVTFSRGPVHGALESWNIGDAPLHKRLAELLWLLTNGGPTVETLEILRDITVEHASMLESRGLVKRKDLFDWETIRPAAGVLGEIQMCVVADEPVGQRWPMEIVDVSMQPSVGTDGKERVMWTVVGLLPKGSVPDEAPIRTSQVHVLSRGVWVAYKRFAQVTVSNVDQLKVTYQLGINPSESGLEHTDVWDLMTLEGPPDSLLPEQLPVEEPIDVEAAVGFLQQLFPEELGQEGEAE